MNTQQAELTTYEQLKEICDKIGYQMPGKLRYSNESGYWNISTLAITDEREIIFTQEFMDKYAEVLFEKGGDSYDLWQVLKHLDNPTEYLYNLIK